MKRALFALALAAALPMSAQAGELSYTYVEGGYSNYSLSAGVGSAHLDGYSIGGSYNFADSDFFVAGSYEATEQQFIEIDRTLIGFGYHHGITDSADFVAKLDYLSYDINGFDTNGYRVSAGFRGTVTDKFEASIMAAYEDTSDTDGDFGVTVQGQYKFNETLGLVAGVGIGQVLELDYVNYSVGLRASF